MDMKEFTYLIALAEEGSISKAAQRLYMAQSSLSQFLQQFESELGTKLFVRTSKGIHPTYSGACFIEQTRQILLYHRVRPALQFPIIKSAQYRMLYVRKGAIGKTDG